MREFFLHLSEHDLRLLRDILSNDAGQPPFVWIMRKHDEWHRTERTSRATFLGAAIKIVELSFPCFRSIAFGTPQSVVYLEFRRDHHRIVQGTLEYQTALPVSRA